MRNVWSEFAASLGLTLDAGEQDLIFFMQSWEEVHDWFAARCDAAPAQDLLAEQVLRRAIALAPTFRVFADSAAEVELLCATGLPQAVVTNAERRYLDAVLRGTGIASSFATTVSRDDVHRGKPDPEPYLLAADRLGVDPADCLVVEDTSWGAASGSAAGCRVVRVDLHRSAGGEMSAVR